MALPTIRFIARTGGAQQGMNKLGNATIRFSQAATSNIARVGAAIGAVGALSVRMASDLDEQLRRVQNLTGFSQDQRLALGDSLDQLSRKHGLDARSLAEAAEAVHTQGVAVGQLSKELELASKVTNAFGGQLDDIARNLTKMANVWDIATDRIVAYGQAGARIGDTNLSLLLEGSTVVSPAAKQAGVAYDEMAIFMGFATRELKNTRLSATALRQVFDELSRSESRVATTIQNRYGNTFKELVQQAGNAYDVFGRIEKDFGRSRFIQLLSSVDAKSGLTTILQQLDEIKKEAQIPLEVHAEGLNEAFENIAVSFDERLRVMRQAWQSMLRSSADVQPGSNIYGAVEALTSVLEHGDFREAFKQLSETLTSVAPIIGESAKLMSSVMTVNIPGTQTSTIDMLLYGYMAKSMFSLKDKTQRVLGGKNIGMKDADRHLQTATLANMKTVRGEVAQREMMDKAFKKRAAADPFFRNNAMFLFGPKASGVDYMQDISDEARDFKTTKQLDRHMRKEMLKDPAIQDDLHRKTMYGGKLKDPSARTIRDRSREYAMFGTITPDRRLAENKSSKRFGRLTSGQFLAGFHQKLARSDGRIGKHFTNWGTLAGKASAMTIAKDLGKGTWGMLKGAGMMGARVLPGLGMAMIGSDILKGMTGIDVLGDSAKMVGKAISFINPFDDKKKKKQDFSTADARDMFSKFSKRVFADEGAQKELSELGDKDRPSLLLRTLNDIVVDNAVQVEGHRQQDKSDYVRLLNSLIAEVKDSALPETVIAELVSAIQDEQTTVAGDLDLNKINIDSMQDLVSLMSSTPTQIGGETKNMIAYFDEAQKRQLKQAAERGDVETFSEIMRTLPEQAWQQLGVIKNMLETPEAAADKINEEGNRLANEQRGEWRKSRSIWQQIGDVFTGEDGGQYNFQDVSPERARELNANVVHDPGLVGSLIDTMYSALQSERAEEQARVLPSFRSLMLSGSTEYGEGIVSNLKNVVREAATFEMQLERDKFIRTGESQYTDEMSRPWQSGLGGDPTAQDILNFQLAEIERAVADKYSNLVEPLTTGFEEGDVTAAEILRQTSIFEDIRDTSAATLGVLEDAQESRNIYYAGVIYSDYDARAGV